MTRARHRFILGCAVVAVGAVFFLGLLFFPVPKDNVRVVDMVAGLVLGWGAAVIQYYFGTSEGSVAKSEQIDRLIDEERQ
jgi:hypothetical protein